MRIKKKLSLTALKIFLLISLSFSFFAKADAQHFSESRSSEYNANSWVVDMVGFNYTDRAIDSYSINGEGAGNVLLSSQTNGGGKSACCITILPTNSGALRLRVRWQVDGCKYLTQSRLSKEVSANLFPYYRQLDVTLPLPKNLKPQHLEVHFYPDGSVDARLTEFLSLPRILLDGQRPDMSNFPWCRDDKKPQ